MIVQQRKILFDAGQCILVVIDSSCRIRQNHCCSYSLHCQQVI